MGLCFFIDNEKLEFDIREQFMVGNLHYLTQIVSNFIKKSIQKSQISPRQNTLASNQ